MNKGLLNCSNCHNRLTSYEEHKYQNLLEHFGMQVRQPPRCTNCYWKDINKAKEKYENKRQSL